MAFQALFRGYRVRRAYIEFCREAFRFYTRADNDSDGSDYDYEEVNLTDFDMDEVLLPWQPAQTPRLPLW